MEHPPKMTLLRVHTPRCKLESHTQEFLGYFEESKAYRLMKKSDKRIIISRDVIFQKNSMKLTSNKELNFEKNELLLYPRSFQLQQCTNHIKIPPKSVSILPFYYKFSTAKSASSFTINRIYFPFSKFGSSDPTSTS